MKIFDWNNFLTNSSELQYNQINDTKANLEELRKEYEEIFKENPQSKVKGKLAHILSVKERYCTKISSCSNSSNCY